MNIFSIVAFFLSTVLLASCTLDIPEKRQNDMIGIWASNKGYEVRLNDKGNFAFCDKEICELGVYEKPFGSNSYAIVLKDFFLLSNTRRFQDDLRSIGTFDGLIANNYPDFDFSPNFGISPSQRGPEECAELPCVYKGSVEDFSEGILFTKQEKLR